VRNTRTRQEIPEQPKQQVWLAGGKVIKVGDTVSVNRDGWRDKIGVYVGKNYKRKQLKVHFEEFGGAELFCYPNELRRLPAGEDNGERN
jgi:transcription antitermination factor NusG